MKRFEKQTNGQLTLGLAFGFTMILALFAFVFNTSMNVREKIKLQQTTDYAALVAANAQKEYLNRIKELNTAIEAEWFTALALQQISHCNNPLYSSPAPITNGQLLRSVVVSNINLKLAALNISGAGTMSTDDLPTESNPDVPAGVNLCDQQCDKYNQAVNKRIRQQYAQFRAATKSKIMNIVMNANQASFQFSLYHFLQPSNLPWGLQQKLKTVIGDGFTLDETLSAYNNQTISTQANNSEWGYDIVSENKDDPLFLPKDESRIIPLPNFFYAELQSPYSYDPLCQTQTGYVYNPLQVGNSRVKIIKDGIFETHFFTGVNYIPPANMFENNEALVKRRVSMDEFGQTESRLDNPALFQRKIGMSTRAVAKPFGGTFPKSFTRSLTSLLTSLIGGSGNTDTPNDFNASAGKKFEGAKLIGIADEEELGGYEIFRANIEAEVKDQQGNIQEVWKIKREDYLH